MFANGAEGVRTLRMLPLTVGRVCSCNAIVRAGVISISNVIFGTFGRRLRTLQHHLIGTYAKIGQCSCGDRQELPCTSDSI